MTASALNLTIEQGATFTQAIALGASTWNGQSATALLYDRFGGNLLATLTCSAIAADSVTISLTAAETGELDAPAYIRNTERKFVFGYWELTATTGPTITRLREGVVYLSRQVAA
jgi:hypothetical protein